MTEIRIFGGLPFVHASLVFANREIKLDRCLVDTGSFSTIFAADKVVNAGIVYEPNDRIRQIRGVGGTEFVFTKTVDRILVDELSISEFRIEVGLMDYGFELDAILGMDFLTATGAYIDLKNMQLESQAL